MNRLIRDWNELLTYEKVFRVLTLIFAVATMALAILSLLDKMDMEVVQLCLGFMILCQGIHFWRKHKRTAIFSLCAAAFIFLVVVVVAFL